MNFRFVGRGSHISLALVGVIISVIAVTALTTVLLMWQIKNRPAPGATLWNIVNPKFAQKEKIISYAFAVSGILQKFATEKNSANAKSAALSLYVPDPMKPRHLELILNLDAFEAATAVGNSTTLRAIEIKLKDIATDMSALAALRE